MSEMTKLKQEAIKRIHERSEKYNVVVKKIDPKSEIINYDIVLKVRYSAEIIGSRAIPGVLPVKISVILNNTSKTCSSSLSTNIRNEVIENLKKVDSIRRGPYISSIAEEVERQVWSLFGKMFNTKVSATTYTRTKPETDHLPASVIKVRCSIEEYSVNATASGNIIFMDSKHNKILECGIQKITQDGKSRDECGIVSGTMELDPATLYAGLIKTDKDNVFRVGPKVFTGIIDLALKEWDAACRDILLKNIRNKRSFILASGSKVIPCIKYSDVADIFKNDAISEYVKNNTHNVEESAKKGRSVRVKNSAVKVKLKA